MAKKGKAKTSDKGKKAKKAAKQAIPAMPERAKIGFGIVGGGVIGPLHARAITAQPDARLVAVCDIVPAAAEKLADAFGAEAMTDLDAMLARDDIQVVAVCVPSGLHAEIGIKAAQAGKHVICEKPIDITLDAADRLIAACDTAGVRLQVISQHRFGAGMQRLKQAIDDGALGTLVMGNASIFWYRAQAYYDSGGWRGTWELDGGGCLMNQGVHYVDLLRWAMGPVTSVTAKMGTLAHERIEVEDVAVAVIQFENGAIGSLVGTTDAFPGYTCRLEIVGTEGSVILEDGEITAWNLKAEVGEVGAYGRSKEAKRAEASQNGKSAGHGAADPAAIAWGGHAYEVRDMIDAIREERAVVLPGPSARHALELILAIYRSAESGRAVTMPMNPKWRPGVKKTAVVAAPAPKKASPTRRAATARTGAK
ncbi:MAG: Gfo/Idh/MocA family oxidoreductase [Chloroflexota bacterium]|nr:Gfo/Idh/MocA family oxidoreductase [Chloroflexota bacterium]